MNRPSTFGKCYAYYNLWTTPKQATPLVPTLVVSDDYSTGFLLATIVAYMYRGALRS